MRSPGLWPMGEPGSSRTQPPRAPPWRGGSADPRGLDGEGAAYRARGALRPVRRPWPGGKRLGREPGVQEEAPADTAAFGMGGITMPPRDLCIFSSLQCRYCLEICTWERRLGGKFWKLTSLAPHIGWSLLSGATEVAGSAGKCLLVFLFSHTTLGPHTHPTPTPCPRKLIVSFLFQDEDLRWAGQGSGEVRPYSFLLLLFVFLFFSFQKLLQIRAETDLQKHLV